jgi:hypothetical protein
LVRKNRFGKSGSWFQVRDFFDLHIFDIQAIEKTPYLFALIQLEYFQTVLPHAYHAA